MAPCFARQRICARKKRKGQRGEREKNTKRPQPQDGEALGRAERTHERAERVDSEASRRLQAARRSALIQGERAAELRVRLRQVEREAAQEEQEHQEEQEESEEERVCGALGRARACGAARDAGA